MSSAVSTTSTAAKRISLIEELEYDLQYATTKRQQPTHFQAKLCKRGLRLEWRKGERLTLLIESTMVERPANANTQKIGHVLANIRQPGEAWTSAPNTTTATDVSMPLPPIPSKVIVFRTQDVGYKVPSYRPPISGPRRDCYADRGCTPQTWGSAHTPPVSNTSGR
ncbi:hypothetical protein P691DRAFT_759584 [Macrolepiota fuliginosa MF-IS2]|uniref:Uncharacterized protein n=1 Tax=Macrolepiota fuliginosa MF-IS2 TaxID=1400762 RepID=A0A9P5XCE8_9AGAR|nr:hypothetical protein P691DRAFT_759584 [Macrolepiota fuliginosa MF-IS2]